MSVPIPAEALTAFVMREVDRRDARIVELVTALNGFVWLGNNLHNIETPLFRELFEQCLVDARTALVESEAVR